MDAIGRTGKVSTGTGDETIVERPPRRTPAPPLTTGPTTRVSTSTLPRRYDDDGAGGRRRDVETRTRDGQGRKGAMNPDTGWNDQDDRRNRKEGRSYLQFNSYRLVPEPCCCLRSTPTCHPDELPYRCAAQQRRLGYRVRCGMLWMGHGR